jgi:predicted nucleic-acid-binding Zn-ribbon protein
MALNQDQLNKIAAVLNQKIKLPCPSCGERQWKLGTEPLVLFAFDIQTRTPQRNGYPSIVLICKVCGLTHLYNAYTLGVADMLGLPPET